MTAQLHFGPHADPATLPAQATSLVVALLDSSHNSSALITSLARTPADLARVMYENLESQGVEAQRELYLAPGRQVIDTYVEAKNQGLSSDIVKLVMTKKILEVGPTNVSHHCCDPAKLCVIDISPILLDHPQWFETAVIMELRPGGRVSKFLRPSSHDPAFHLEIPLLVEVPI